MIKVYIASPYTIGDVAKNVHVSFEMANRLRMLKNVLPIAPLRAHFEHLLYPQEYETWMAEDYEYVMMADAVLRLSGESAGADREVAWAHAVNIPVFLCIGDLIHQMKLKVKPGKEVI